MLINFIPEAEWVKEKLTSWTSPNLKLLFCERLLKERKKRQIIGWEKITANHLFDKRVLSRIYKEFSEYVLCCVWLFARPWTAAAGLLCPWDFPGKNAGTGRHFLLQGVLTTQGSNKHLSPAPAGEFFTSSATWKAPLKTQQLGILKTQLTKIQGIEIIHTLPVER